jgi:hypothetical protein
MLFRSIFILFAFLLLLSCNKGSNCYESSETLMVSAFTGNKSIPINSFLVRGYKQIGLGDTLASSTTSSPTIKAALPLALSSDSTGFVVFVNGRSGIFWIRHTMDLRLISQSCGFAPYYKLTALKYSSLIDSIKVSDLNVDPKSVDNYETNGQNITVYLHLSTP